jgi:hypothetical protein
MRWSIPQIWVNCDVGRVIPASPDLGLETMSRLGIQLEIPISHEFCS